MTPLAFRICDLIGTLITTEALLSGREITAIIAVVMGLTLLCYTRGLLKAKPVFLQGTYLLFRVCSLFGFVSFMMDDSLSATKVVVFAAAIVQFVCLAMVTRRENG